MRRLILAVVVLAFVLSVPTSAQMPTAEKWENAEWYSVMSWQFALADADSSTTLFFEYFMPAMKQAWPDTKCFQHMVGEWHVTCFGPMAEGPAAFEWRTSPESVTFMSALMEQQGEGWVEVGEWFMRSTTRFTFSFGLDPSGAM